jgi:pimeloyl-ACP methyl ester carboxylesterase
VILTRRAVVAGGVAMALVPKRAEADITDSVLIASDGRSIAIRTVSPHRINPRRAILLLSHGANGTFEGLDPLMTALARDRVVMAPLHVDSEKHAQHGKLPPAEVWRTRIEDMRLLAASVRTRAPLVAVGHSYGALVAQALGGATVFGKSVADPRIRAVVAISPPGPFVNFVGREDWARMTVPMLVTTGTADVVPMLAPEWTAHLASYEASKVRGNALWVGEGVDHYFGKNIQRLSRDAPDQSAAFRVMLDIVNRYIAATVEDDSAARRWIWADGPKRTGPRLTARWAVNRQD